MYAWEDLIVKKKWLLAFLINAYILQLLLLLDVLPNNLVEDYPELFLCIYLALLVFMVFLVIMNIVYSIKLHKLAFHNTIKGNSLKTIMIFKIGFIPFFLINFLFWLCLIGILLNPMMGFIGVFLIPMALISTYTTMLITSVYGISLISVMGRKNMLTWGQCVIHIIFQLIFIVDVVDLIFLFVKYRKVNGN